MPTWGTILREFQQSAAERAPNGADSDGIRLKYINQLRGVSGRAVIVYASGWLSGKTGVALDYSVVGSDVHALMEVCHDVEEQELDLVLHSPGGSAEAAEQMINYLRTQFDYIRALVPLQAKSAATIMALGCDEIVLGRHSELGPIDPQIQVPVPGGQRFSPAHAILRDFERAKTDIAADLNNLAGWTPILHAYAGGLLEFCNQQIRLSQDIVERWLSEYMLSHADSGLTTNQGRGEAAQRIADYFGSEDAYGRFRSHARPIRIEEL